MFPFNDKITLLTNLRTSIYQALHTHTHTQICGGVLSTSDYNTLTDETLMMFNCNTTAKSTNFYKWKIATNKECICMD